jgi:hypothetical protein
MARGEISATAEVDRWHQWGSVTRSGLAALLTLILLLSIASVSYASSSFYWYGQNGSTCWQTGEPGSPSEKCSVVGPGYLPTPGGNTGGLAYMLEGGVYESLNLSPSADYCSYDRLGDELKYQNSTNEGGISGWKTPTPYSSYQEGDKESGAWNTCQADGSHWGQAIKGVSGKGCTESCGIKHYVSFRSQESKDNPWPEVFGEPSLVISAEAGIHDFSASGSYYGGWGYVCPELEDTEPSFHGIIEYCLEEWRSTNNAPEWKDERKGECGADYVEVISYFWPGTSLATEMPGSANTFEVPVGGSGSGHYEARITEANLKNAVELANKCAGWHLTTNAKAYALVGVEQGLEGWSGLTALGGWGDNLQLRTEYITSGVY